MMAQAQMGVRDKRGDWQPPGLVKAPPVFVWPAQPLAFLKWLFGYPGYLLPWNVAYMAIAALTWLFLTPPLDHMKTFGAGWIAFIAGRNLAMLILIVGAWHLRLYVQRAQGQDFKYSGKWLATKNPTFLFGNQVADNIFWTVASAWPIWTAYEVVTMWAYANHWLPYVDWARHPVYCVLLMCAIPAIRDVHFYLIHRLIHWPPLYRSVHFLHHNNVNVGPWSGLSMHPVEHLFYFSGVLVHWIIPSHPLHAIFHLQHAAFSPAQGHAGFERVVLKDNLSIQTHDYRHFLHHKYFECNYGGDGVVPLDNWFGTFNDGSETAHEAMNRRFLSRHKAAQKPNRKATQTAE